MAAPVATHSGWFSRPPGTGGEGQNVGMIGSTIAFPRDAEARRRAGDPRPSIAERYRDRGDYVAQARGVAERLAAEGYLLPDDVELAACNAVERYDAFA